MADLTADKYGNRSGAVGKRFGRLKTAHGFGDRHVFHSIRKCVTKQFEQAGISENVAADVVSHKKTQDHLRAAFRR